MNKFDEAIMSSLVNKEQHLQLTKEKYRNNQHLQKMLISKEERHDLVVKQLELGKLYKELYDTSPFRQPQKHTEIENKIKEIENE